MSRLNEALQIRLPPVLIGGCQFCPIVTVGRFQDGQEVVFSFHIKLAIQTGHRGRSVRTVVLSNLPARPGCVCADGLPPAMVQLGEEVRLKPSCAAETFEMIEKSHQPGSRPPSLGLGLINTPQGIRARVVHDKWRCHPSSIRGYG
ncbi:unnamed protein product [Protopolystoma xenopodis]|uniref:Uncharacterized protein n=1 Tax=Protopolystoma xenopodis TaxID=117903 RepID=A0A448WCX7_9PLAT|nr:unnamed protein product [Protopolystoma xenopodis]